MNIVKNVLITGVSRGLGKSLASSLSQRNYSVYGISREQPVSQAGEIDLGCSPNFIFESIDLSVLERIATSLDSFLHNVEEWELIILNAGILNPIKDLSQTPIHEIQKLMDLHLYANKILLDTLFALSKKIKRVLSISSGAAVSGNRGWNAYALSKCSQNMLIKMYAEEEPETHFISLAPGLVRTGMQDFIAASTVDERYKKIQELQTKYQQNEILFPNEVGEKIVAMLDTIFSFPSGSFVDLRNLKDPLS